MKEIKIIKYKSEDGKIFNEKTECQRWEKCIERADTIDDTIIKDINDFLSVSDNYGDWIKERINETDTTKCYGLHLGSHLGGTYEIVLGDGDEDGFIELDEDFCIDSDKWDNFIKELSVKYDCDFSIPYYYWSK